jgi:hypothetical protein
MVSDLEGHLGRRGLGMIPPEIGAARLADELEAGTKGDVEVIIAGDLGSMTNMTGAAGSFGSEAALDSEPESAAVPVAMAVGEVER